MRTPPEPDTARVFAALAGARARVAARDEEIVRAQVAVSEIPAPTGDEGERGAWVARRFAALGLRDVRADDAGNVVGLRPGVRPGPPVVVCAHLDTVFAADTPVRVRRDGARLVGPGIGDNGRGLAGMLALAEVIDGAAVRTERSVLFAATTGEEGSGDLRGAKHLFERFAGPPAAAVILDGAGDERVVSRALGSRRFRVTFRGPGGHSWAAFGVPNAIHAAAALAGRIATLPLPRDPRTALSVCRIGGGTTINSIPEEAWLEIDLRSTAAAVVDRYDAEVRRAARAAATGESAGADPHAAPLAVAVEVIGDRPSGAVPDDAPLVRSALAATRLIGRAPALAAASTDANVPISLGVPAIAIGAGGRGGDAHTTSEWYENIDGTLGVARALTIVVEAAGMR